jgi:uncharacterized protein (DUF302 family)
MGLLRNAAMLTTLAALAGCGAMHGDMKAGGMHANHGLVSVKSPHNQADTLARLEAQVKQRNLVVVARIDHAAGAQRVSQTLRPTEVMIFGNPQAGTPLMQCAQGAGIELPMKALVWTDAAGQTWLGYNDPGWIVHRHGGGDCPAVDNVRKALAAIADATVAR